MIKQNSIMEQETQQYYDSIANEASKDFRESDNDQEDK